MLDRNRGGSYVALGTVGIGMYGSFFFLTYYLQQTLGFSPVQAGAAFLPLIAAVMVTATTSSSLLLRRTGRRPLVTLGMLLAAAGSVLLAQLGVGSTYAAHVLPGLIATGLGLGLIMAPAMNTGTRGVSATNAGVASAMVNTMQQIGASLGTALLSTLAASATSGYLPGTQPSACRGRTGHGARLHRRVLVGGRDLRRRRDRMRPAAAKRCARPEPEPDASPALAA